MPARNKTVSIPKPAYQLLNASSGLVNEHEKKNVYETNIACKEFDEEQL